jgi:hypothetical protein
VFPNDARARHVFICEEKRGPSLAVRVPPRAASRWIRASRLSSAGRVEWQSLLLLGVLVFAPLALQHRVEPQC